MSNEEWFTVEIEEVIRETDDAILVRIDCDEDDVLSAEDDEAEVWIPKSQLMDGSQHLEPGDSGEMNVAIWFAKKRGWF